MDKEQKPIEKIDLSNLESVLEEAASNIKMDRVRASKLLTDVMIFIGKSADRNDKFGLVAAKYLESLQRSNEQLIKIAELMRKNSNTSASLTDDDKEDIYSELEENKED